MKPKKYKRAAKLSINAPGKMTKRGRRDIAGWLRNQASSLLKSDGAYTDKGRFTASFNY